MPFIRCDGIAIHWRLEGARAAPQIVLLHSIGTDMAIYDRLVENLIDDFLLLRIDFRGHGESGASQGDYSLGLLARDVLAVIDEVGIDRAMVCGTSLGGMVAMQLALMAPERLAGLVIANSSAAMAPALWSQRVALVRAEGLAPALVGWAGRHLSPGWMATHPARVETLERGFMQSDPKGYAGCAAAIRDMALLSDLQGLCLPALVIGGEQDTATPFAGHGDRIAHAIPGASTVLLPGGHLACLEDPASFAAALRDLASRCRFGS